MTTHQFILFALLLVLPSAYQRIKFSLKRSSFVMNAFIKFREKGGVQIHHGHIGLLIVFLSSMALAFGYQGWLTIAGVGYGWGLILDEIIPALKMPTIGRDVELDVYARSLRGTIIVIACVVIACVIAFAGAHGAAQKRLPGQSPFMYVG